MKNLFSKSKDTSDFQKFFNMILTEQRAQRVDLARIHKLIKDTTQREVVPEEEIYDGDSGSGQ